MSAEHPTPASDEPFQKFKRLAKFSLEIPQLRGLGTSEMWDIIEKCDVPEEESKLRLVFLGVLHSLAQKLKESDSFLIKLLFLRGHQITLQEKPDAGEAEKVLLQENFQKQRVLIQERLVEVSQTLGDPHKAEALAVAEAFLTMEQDKLDKLLLYLEYFCTLLSEM